MSVMISAVVVALNEAEKLHSCLESIKNFAEEIIVVNLNSTDETAKVGKKYGKVYSHKEVVYVEIVRNWAIDKAHGDWILILDPDEILSAKLAVYLKGNIDQEFIAFNIPRKNIFFNSWIKHSNFWPDKQIRFFKKNTVKWPTKLHTYPKVAGNVKDVEVKEDLAIIHYGYSSYSEFIRRQDRYARIEVDERVSNKERTTLLKLFWNPFRIFLVRFIKHRGYLDGINGVFIVLVLMYYKFQVEWKLLKIDI